MTLTILELCALNYETLIPDDVGKVVQVADLLLPVDGDGLGDLAEISRSLMVMVSEGCILLENVLGYLVQQLQVVLYLLSL